MELKPEILKRISEISSEGLNLEEEDFNEVLGLNNKDFEFLMETVAEIEKESENLRDAFYGVYELSKYANDDIVKSFLMFHLGVLLGKKITLKNIANIDKEIFTTAYKQGFADGFKSGFEKGMEMAEFVKNFKSQE